MTAIEEVVIAGGDIEVTVLPGIGARLHRLRAFGHDILRAPDDVSEHRRDPFFWGAYVMAPWGGRIAARPTEVLGATIDLASNFPDGTAIHGTVYESPWDRTDDGSFRVGGGGDKGWPWPFESRLALAIDGGTVRIDQSVTNLAGSPMPAGLGLHPWFLHPLEVEFAAEAVYESNLDSTPTAVPVSGAHDLRQLAPMPDGLDATWTVLGDPPVRFRWPDLGIEAWMRADSPSLHIVAASPPAIDAVAIEPQTHAPHAIRRLLAGEPGALTVLSPGATLSLATDLVFARP
jgi:aldose 1-epimerase